MVDVEQSNDTWFSCSECRLGITSEHQGLK